jgi:hypothetical protein
MASARRRRASSVSGGERPPRPLPSETARPWRRPRPGNDLAVATLLSDPHHVPGPPGGVDAAPPVARTARKEIAMRLLQVAFTQACWLTRRLVQIP